MPERVLIITDKQIQCHTEFLREQERSAATIQKYARDLTALAAFLKGMPVTKGALLE